MPAKMKLCRVHGCGRRVYSQRCCQTHHRDLLAGKPFRAIRQYRERSREPTARFAGMTWPAPIAALLRQSMKRLGCSEQAVVVGVVLHAQAALR